MKSIPEEEQPLIKSTYWRRQLHKQLPAADFVLDHNVSLHHIDEITAYKRYVQDRDLNACSVAKAFQVQSDDKVGCHSGTYKSLWALTNRFFTGGIVVDMCRMW